VIFMRKGMFAAITGGGPFRLLKYFIISGFAVIAIVTFLLGAFLYTRNVDTLLRSAENYARLLAENLNYNIYIGFYAPLKTRGTPMDLRKWDQFGALDSLIKDFTYGLKIQRIKVIDLQRKIAYSTEYDLIGKYEAKNSAVDEAAGGKDTTLIRQERGSPTQWHANWLADTYYPLRESTGNYWMLGNIYGVIQITQDVTDQYVALQRSIIVVILVAAGLMVFLFVMLTLIVRRGERILLEQGQEQKRLEEQLQQSEKLASIGQMVATIAHEIRNPLGIVRSSAEVLAKKTNPDPSKIQKLSRIIVEEATRLSSILTDFLDFARPRSPNPKAIDVRDVIARVRNNLEEEIQARRIQWLDQQLNGVHPIIMGDSDLLYQAFLNVAMNAFEAMKDGGTLTISVSQEASKIRVDFADDGHGIREDDLPKIFTPFFTTHEMGTGLGLSVVHNIIIAHGGEVSVRSREGGGAEFTISLPAEDQPVGGVHR
jgi:two-component system, NtrC family, sensor histidine kinase HydH